jgi:hypothetical protein
MNAKRRAKEGTFVCFLLGDRLTSAYTQGCCKLSELIAQLKILNSIRNYGTRLH